MIEIITGLPGFGKTLTATKWALNEMKKGKKVYANYPLEGAEYFVDPMDVIGKVTNATIVVDEVGVVFDQLRMYDMPVQTWMELRQHRKDGVDLVMTAQSLSDVAYPLRRLIQFEHNIFMKFGRLVIVNCRTPQKGGDNYGKRFWWISKSVFGKYDTHHKVALEKLEKEATEQSMSEDKFIGYRDVQEKMLLDAIIGIEPQKLERNFN